MHFALLLGPRHGHDDERVTLLQPRTLPEPPTRRLRSVSRQQRRRRQRRRQRGKLGATRQSACKQASSETSAVSWCLGSWGRELAWGQSGHARKRRTTITRSMYIFCKSNSTGFHAVRFGSPLTRFCVGRTVIIDVACQPQLRVPIPDSADRPD